MKIISKDNDSDNGTWEYSESELLLTYLKEDYSPTFKQKIRAAYHAALEVFKIIEDKVLKETGKPVKDGLYQINLDAMFKIMNSISGMALTSTIQKEFSAKGAGSKITVSFFKSLLNELGSEVPLIRKYLITEMSKLQTQADKLSANTEFGTLIAVIDGIEAFDTVTTSFKFITLTSKESVKSFIDLRCKSICKVKFEVDYAILGFTYSKPESTVG